MNKPLVDRFPFAKIATILAIMAGVSLGLCGVGTTLLQFSSKPGMAGKLALLPLAIGIGAFWLSILGLVLTFVVWIIAALVSGGSRNGM